MFTKIFKTLFLFIAISLFVSVPIWADSNNEFVEIPIRKQDKSHLERNLSGIPIQCLYDCINWIEAELTNLLVIVEHDNGDPKTITASTGFTYPETGITNTVTSSVTITDKDELIYQQNLKRTYVFSSIGTGRFISNGFEWVTDITEYTL